jgi:hypothetical protein
MSAVLVPALSQTAAAGNPHFIKSATNATLSGTDLIIHFKEAGLPAGSVEAITGRANAATTYECVNGGGKNPAASNKSTFQSLVSKTDTFTADRNGNVVGTETLSPPTAADLGFTCPPGQTTTFVSVVYSNVHIDDATSGASISIPGTFSATNPSAPPVR